MIVLGLIPKAGALVAGIPHPVLGGAALAMFATVAVVGIQTLSRVDFHDHRNVVIVSTAIGLAVYVTVQPDVAKAVPSWAQIIFGSGITLGSIVAIGLNLLFHHVGRSRGAAVAGAPGRDLVGLNDVNQMSREEFVETFGGLFQGPRWVVERAYDERPFADTRDLRRAFQDALLRREQGRAAASCSRPTPSSAPTVVARARPARDRSVDQSALGLTRLDDEAHGELAALARRSTASGSASR